MARSILMYIYIRILRASEVRSVNDRMPHELLSK